MQWRSYFWKLLKTIPFAELVFQSYSIQAYLWLCSPSKWLPEHEMSQDLYKSASVQLQRRMSFTLSRLANALTASELPYVFCSYLLERTKTKHCCKKRTVGQRIFQGTKFEDWSFKSEIVQLLRWPLKVKRAASTKRAISFAGRKSFTGFSVQTM